MERDELLRVIERAAEEGWTRLNLNQKGIMELPPQLWELNNLSELYLNANRLKELSAEIGHLTHLTRLSLWSNQLRALPPEIGKLTKLMSLDMSGNQLSSLPAEICKLTNLIELDLGYNNLSTLPTNIGKLKNLGKLDLRRNPLPIPPEILEKAEEPARIIEHYLKYLASQKRLEIFLCHASGDKPAVRELYLSLKENNVDPWLDEEDLIAGQDWQLEIPRAVRAADVVIVCLTQNSVTKRGYVQKEIRFALDAADEQPEGAIFIIPLRLEECEVPERLSRWQWVDLFRDGGYKRLMRALRLKAEELGVAEVRE